MVRRLAPLLCAAVSWLFAGTAAATVGGPVTVSVLGYAPVDEKVYLLFRSHGESEELPQLAYVPLTGRNAGRVVKVRSWYRDDDGTDAFRESFRERLGALQGRLRSNSPASRSSVRLHTRTQRRITWREIPGDPEVEGRRIRVRASSAKAGRSGALSVDAYGCLRDPETRDSLPTCPRVRLVEVLEFPTADITVAVVESLGIPYEGGYAHQMPIVLTAP